MMTPEDIKNILYRKCREVFPDIPAYKDVHPPVTERDVSERIVINVLSMNNDPWSKGYGNVNLFVPYDKSLKYPTPNGPRLRELGNIAEDEFRSVYFNEPAGRGVYSIDSIFTEHDEATWSYFVNVRLFIKTNNFKL